MIRVDQAGRDASELVDGIPAGRGNWPQIHDMIARRVLAMLHDLARSQTGIQSGRPEFRETRSGL